jgi:hypothetical protein
MAALPVSERFPHTGTRPERGRLCPCYRGEADDKRARSIARIFRLRNGRETHPKREIINGT